MQVFIYKVLGECLMTCTNTPWIVGEGPATWQGVSVGVWRVVYNRLGSVVINKLLMTQPLTDPLGTSHQLMCKYLVEFHNSGINSRILRQSLVHYLVGEFPIVCVVSAVNKDNASHSVYAARSTRRGWAGCIGRDTEKVGNRSAVSRLPVGV